MEFIENAAKNPTAIENLFLIKLLKSHAINGDLKPVRDQVVTFLLAGYETTGLAMAWLWYLLAQHPRDLERIEAEVSDVLGPQAPSSEQLSQLQYTRCLIEESLRLFPSVPVISRKAIADDDVCGHKVRAGEMLQLSPWVTHRHPKFWVDATEFRPERLWTERNARPEAIFRLD